MAKELIKSDRTIRALKRGAGRLSDGAGLYLLPFVKGAGSHCWRFDYTHQGKRKTISLGVYPQVGLALARERADKARAQVAEGGDPSQERKDSRALTSARNEAERRVAAGNPATGSFEEVARRWFGKVEDGWVEVCIQPPPTRASRSPGQGGAACAPTRQPEIGRAHV